MNEPTVNELFDLKGKVALITGASGWLGTAFARALAEAGATFERQDPIDKAISLVGKDSD